MPLSYAGGYHHFIMIREEERNISLPAAALRGHPRPGTCNDAAELKVVFRRTIFAFSAFVR